MNPSNAGRALAAKRKTHSGGDTSVLRPCPFCAHVLNARTLRAHKPRCVKNPKNIAKTKADRK